MTRPAAPRPPWITHVVTMLGFSLWWYHGTLSMYGVDGSSGWWDPSLNVHGLVIVLVVVVAPGAPLAWQEAWAVTQGKGWGAHLLAVVFTLMAGFAAHFFSGLRFWGDTSPTELATLTFAWVTYPVMVGLQLALVWWMTHRGFPPVNSGRGRGRGRGRELAKRLGLVE